MITLRPFLLPDITDPYLKALNDPTESKYLASQSKHYRREDVTVWAEQVINNPCYRFFAVMNDSTHIGNAKLGPIDWIARRTHYGRLLWEKGHGTHVLRLMIVYVFEQLNLERMVDFGVVTNIASMKSNLRAGMLKEGTITNWGMYGGKMQDVYIYGLTKEQYVKKAKDIKGEIEKYQPEEYDDIEVNF